MVETTVNGELSGTTLKLANGTRVDSNTEQYRIKHESYFRLRLSESQNSDKIFGEGRILMHCVQVLWPPN